MASECVRAQADRQLINEVDPGALGDFLSHVAAGDAVTFEERFLPLLRSLQVLMPATSASAGVVNLKARRPVPRESLTAASGIGRDQLLRYLGGHVRHDPALSSIRAGSGCPARWSDYGSGGDDLRPSFRRFVHANGLCHLLGWSFRMPDGATLVVSLHRAEGMEDFTETDLVLARVVSRALALVGQRGAVGEFLRMQAAADREASLGGVLVTDESGVLTVDRGAAALLAVAGLQARNELLRRVGQAVADSNGRRVGIEFTAATGALRATALPLSSHERPESTCVIVSAGPSKLAIPDGLGLTSRQVELTLLVAEGRSDREIAAELDCSYSAVCKGLARVRAKLGAKNRNELIALVRAGRRDERGTAT